MYTFCIIMIAIASILLILAVLVQSPKSGMAANFGAANQTMGVRQTTDFLEKFTWAMVAAIVIFTLLSVTAAPKTKEVVAEQNAAVEGALNVIAPEEVAAEDLAIDGAVVEEEAATEEAAAVEAAPTEEVAAEETTEE